jgi:antitoxin HicB
MHRSVTVREQAGQSPGAARCPVPLPAGGETALTSINPAKATKQSFFMSGLLWLPSRDAFSAGPAERDTNVAAAVFLPEPQHFASDPRSGSPGSQADSGGTFRPPVRSLSMLEYTVRLIPDEDGGVIATFPDVPEAVSKGATEDEAFDGALDALEKTLAAYVADGRAVPAPSDICCAPKVATTRFDAEAPQAEAKPERMMAEAD